jgi:hypothetical protein
MYEDHGFESRYNGLRVVCLANCEPGSMIATAPRIYHKRNKRGGLLRFGHLVCVINARKTSVVSLGGDE